MATMQILVPASSCHPASSGFVGTCLWFELPCYVCLHCVSHQAGEDEQTCQGAEKGSSLWAGSIRVSQGSPSPRMWAWLVGAHGCGELGTSSAVASLGQGLTWGHGLWAGLESPGQMQAGTAVPLGLCQFSISQLKQFPLIAQLTCIHFF